MSTDQAARRRTDEPRPKPRGDESRGQSERDNSSANVAPDAVTDPNEKTDGKPGMPVKRKDVDADPGGG